MLLRFAAQARCAASTGTSSCALRPDGKLTVAVSSHGGGDCTRLLKNGLPVIPVLKRLRTVGRSRTPSRTGSAWST